MDQRGNFLGDRFQVAVSPGMQYQADSEPWKGLSRESTALVVGDPAARDWAPLPGAQQEALAVAGEFNHPHLVLDTDMSVREIASQIPQSDVFHFSGHTSTGVEASGMVVGDAGLFQARDLLPNRTGRTQLVVLSACASARGTTGFFDDDDSFVQQLAAAGVPEIVASRWRVDSTATAELMKDFYGNLLQGQTVPQALGQASRFIRANPRFSHPYYWASFEAFGKG
jgi:CHAT domain-containing protein